MLVMSKLDQTQEEDMFENMCHKLKLVLGSRPGVNKDEPSGVIKFENADLLSEEVLLAHGFVRKWGGGGFRGGRGGGRG